ACPPSDAYVRLGHAALAALAGRRDTHLALPAGVADAVRAAALQVARAHGGLFGIGAVSRAEARALRALDELLANPPALDADALPPRRVTVGLDGGARAALVTDDDVLPVDDELAWPERRTSPLRVRRDGRHWLLEAGAAPVRVDGERV